MLPPRLRRLSWFASWTLATLACSAGLLASAPVRADSVLSFVYTPAPRAQVAIWLEDAKGKFLATVALTEAVAFRGIGNRPGASEMNSGYRWPYGRREGVLPIWAHRRASAPGAKQFPRVIFQSRVEGLASRTTSDQSPDAYYCLQFDSSKAQQDQLDAVSCATAFNSDKGRYMTAKDVMAPYAEPYEAPMQKGEGVRQPLPLTSVYPPRMDVKRCGVEGSCFDTPDVDHYPDDARAVMPEIDAITVATPPGDVEQRVLFSVPKDWPSGDYVAFIEVNLEGDYNAHWNKDVYPTPTTPTSDWDQYSLMYGYPYRGQPSLVWKVSFSLPGGGGANVNAAASDPVGRSSWDVWSADYGKMESVSFDADDPHGISNTVAHSGAGRLAANASGQRFRVSSMSATTPTRPPVSGGDAGAAGQAGQAGSAAGSGGAAGAAGVDAGTSADAGSPDSDTDEDAIGPVEDLSLAPDSNPLRSHTWIRLRMRAVRSELPLHAYEVRVATEPIDDEASFIRNGRQAKNATDAAEGATLLSLPTDVPAGDWIEAGVGDLVAETHYYVAVRATDELNRHGPISVAEITTTKRRFATVTPCFVASVAYGSPLARDVGALRRVRDRYLLPHAPGRAWVDEYYRLGARAAEWLRPHSGLRSLVRALLTPLVRLAHALD